jgi:hypothetical protein
VWVANLLDLTVSKLDPTTGRMIGTVLVGDGPSTIVAAGGAVWVSDEFGATVDRIDPQNDQVVRVIQLGSSPEGMIAAGQGLWVAARPFTAASHRGGTLTVAGDLVPALKQQTRRGRTTPWPFPRSRPPMTALSPSAGRAARKASPSCRTWPGRCRARPTAAGRTISSSRRGIRYSTGAPLRASDFRRGLQRELSFGSSSLYYQGILGARACLRHPASCDLSAGIVTDDTAGTVTLHLSRPDPDFL